MRTVGHITDRAALLSSAWSMPVSKLGDHPAALRLDKEVDVVARAAFLAMPKTGPSEPSTRGRRELVGTIAYQFPFEHGSGNEFRLDLALRPGHHPTRGRRATPRTPKSPPARWINQHEPPRMR